MARKRTLDVTPDPIPLPVLTGRVAVLGGNDQDKTALCVGLAMRQVRQQGTVLCLDARRYRPTEVQFRLLLRGANAHLLLPPAGEVPAEVAQTVLSTVSRGLAGEDSPPPLLLLDGLHTTPEWERTLAFLLKAGTTVVELLRSPTELVFGRYDTVLLLRAGGQEADALSRAVGRKVGAADLEQLPAGAALYIALARVRRVLLPGGEG
ncbi:MAG: hypothetical protein AB1671_25565 [Thermodesulfobacteriota bacterium]|jgi:hypothetical protein